MPFPVFYNRLCPRQKDHYSDADFGFGADPHADLDMHSYSKIDAH